MSESNTAPRARRWPACQRAYAFLAHHAPEVLAPLTGQDKRALDAFAHALELFSVADSPGQCFAVDAMRACLYAMQPHTRIACKRAIPALLNWDDELPLWLRLRIDPEQQGRD